MKIQLEKFKFDSAAIVMTGYVAIITAIMPLHPVLANGLTNIKISDISDQSLEAFCQDKLGVGTGSVQVKRGDRIVGCGIPVSERTDTNVGGEATANGSYGGAGGSASVRGNSSGSSNNTVRYKSFRLTDYCREVVDRSTFFNLITGEGRVFVGDGGYSCYKTVRQQ